MGGAQWAHAPSKPMAGRSCRIRSVLLALPVRFQNALKHAWDRIKLRISSWGSPSDPAGGAYDATPNPYSQLGRLLPPQRLRRLASSSSTTQVQCAPPETVFWIRPWRRCTLQNNWYRKASVVYNVWIGVGIKELLHVKFEHSVLLHFDNDDIDNVWHYCWTVMYGIVFFLSFLLLSFCIYFLYDIS